MSPVFIFGTGRCGSTYLQRLITLRTRCWIWGEHDGFLTPLLESIDKYENSSKLTERLFSQPALEDSEIIDHMVNNSHLISWLSKLRSNSMREYTRSMIDRLFSDMLPDGWDQWGLKEIRYGLNNNSPAYLLNLFPSAVALFSFRNPAATFESMIHAWSPQLAAAPMRTGQLRQAYREGVDHWLSIVRYFLALKEGRNAPLKFVCIDLLQDESQILDSLPLQRRHDRFATLPIGTTNAGRRASPEARAFMDQLFAEVQPECQELFEQAAAICREDLGIPGTVAAPTSS